MFYPSFCSPPTGVSGAGSRCAEPREGRSAVALWECWMRAKGAIRQFTLHVAKSKPRTVPVLSPRDPWGVGGEMKTESFYPKWLCPSPSR
jgi:hypothetical protein